MSQAGKDSEQQALQSLTETIGANISEGAEKTESFFSSACIYRVPGELRKLKESAYTPLLVTIGPLHRKDKHPQTPMQHVKMSYANSLLCRLTQGIQDPELARQKKFEVLKECVEEMKKSVEDAKKYYAEEVGDTLNEEMMLVDGCFILELLYRCKYKVPGCSTPTGELSVGGEESTKESRSSKNGADPIFDSVFTRTTIKDDLVLLENQIPFFVLQKLFRLTLCQIMRPFISLSKLVIENLGKTTTPAGNSANTCSRNHCCILWAFGNIKERSNVGVPPREDNCSHILHMLHDLCFLHDQAQNYEPEKIMPSTSNLEFAIMPSASNLEFAGVKFVPDTGTNQIKVKFTEPQGPFWWCRRATFEIPTLAIYNNTEPFLRNLIAFEQCCPGVSQHVTSYAILMDMLIDTETDVQVLKKAGVLHNRLGADKDVYRLFNNLCKQIVLDGFFFAEHCKKADEYSKRFWPKHLAYLRRQYFDSPWTFIAFCLGFIAFGMSVAQFVRIFFLKKRLT